MADYTHYGSALSPEWTEFAKTYTPPSLPEDVNMAKEIFNDARTALFQRVLGPIGAISLHHVPLHFSDCCSAAVSSEDVSVPTRDGHHIPCRLSFPDVRNSSNHSLPLYIYMHGGGYLFGSVETEDAHCQLLAVGVPCVVLNVGYRHTPEWTFPTPFQDVFDAVDWITETSRAKQFNIDLSNVVIGGVSAGATMSVAAAVREIEQVRNRLLDES